MELGDTYERLKRKRK